ncbi:glucose-1-phosphate thymidylyltransferase [Streptomyces sp. NBC_01754]|uniref:glucose-1-phosphate thymidylyltransferase n=1 Tax=Streptomyces sp. NBC_01754 TaxID=2975930 RepID=UPI002DDBF958|nr:glucose-1-phosphate thymidylyltransferase [Streptomyces sp. NBC_01754]WSC90943.1 glucose-1-phosphate thymidylyltransferase [Streptomyces sp. NBC_01754]WSC96563.1 glucose-1-phosphate thymidylyltransferase [Streptomyces sp. NBC_01754]
MKALVLTGGSGVRLRPFTYSTPKQLMPLANKPVLDHVIAHVRALGATEVCLLTGDWADAITEAMGDGSRFDVTLTYLRQDRPLGLAHAVQSARPFLGDDDFLMYLGDNILTDDSGEAAEIVGDFRQHRPAAGLVVQHVADPRAYGVAEVDTDGSVRRLVEKPSRPRTDLAVVGLYYFTAAIHRATDAIKPSARGELEITDAVQWLIDQGEQVSARRYSGFWKDVGRADDVLHCNRRLLGELRTDVRGEIDPASELRGQVVIEAGARVVRSRIEGPAIIGPGTLIEDSRIGPGTSIGRDCVVRGTHVSDSVVLQGAHIHTSRGLRGSLVGRFATVGPGEQGDPDHHFVIGDHAQIEMTVV